MLLEKFLRLVIWWAASLLVMLGSLRAMGRLARDYRLDALAEDETLDLLAWRRKHEIIPMAFLHCLRSHLPVLDDLLAKPFCLCLYVLWHGRGHFRAAIYRWVIHPNSILALVPAKGVDWNATRDHGSSFCMAVRASFQVTWELLFHWLGVFLDRIFLVISHAV